MSGPSQRTEGARQAPTTLSLTHLAIKPAGSKTKAVHKHPVLT